MGDKVVFEAEDDGPGIPSDALDEIFEPFKRLSGPGESAGSGLGLSFIRKSVEGWGGQVSALCRQSRGTVFRIVLPDGTTRPDPPIAIAGPETSAVPANGTA
jgi:signal transduction histidine kinase